MKIHLLGSSGSGTSTIGKILAKKLNVHFFESDDFFWEETDIPFSIKKSIGKRKLLLENMIFNNESWILSGSALKWGDILLDVSDLIVLVYCKKEERLNRLKEREKNRFNERIMPGNDMYENHKAFIKWAMDYDTGDLEMRSQKSQDLWIQRANCKVLKISNEDLKSSIEQIMNYCLSQPNII